MVGTAIVVAETGKNNPARSRMYAAGSIRQICGLVVMLAPTILCARCIV